MLDDAFLDVNQAFCLMLRDDITNASNGSITGDRWINLCGAPIMGTIARFSDAIWSL